MVIGSFIRSIATREAIAKAIPIVKKVLRGAGKIAVQEATRTMGEKTVDAFTKAPKKVEIFVDKKKSEFIQDAENKAEQLFARQMVILDDRIDKKINKIENKFDEKIRTIFWLFIGSSFIVMILAGLTFSLLLRFFDF